MFKHMVERAEEGARRRKTWHRFLFLNHAFEDEDVFAAYGEENLRRLHVVRQTVDPEGFFQRLKPGHFKLNTMSLKSSAPDVGRRFLERTEL